jgi:actin related protein 2/3 complex, subunit 1A/1B
MARPKEKTTICESGIVSLSFSADKKRAAFSPNNHLVYIAECGTNFTDCTTWKIVSTLERHDHPVTSVDWSPVNNNILTCSQDRTAYVWTEDASAKEWVPSMVMLDTAVTKGATACSWSANGMKVYFGSAGGNVVVGAYDGANDWWHCKSIDKHTSTVTSLAPHPTVNTLLASGGQDGMVLLSSTLTKAADGKPADVPKFGTIIAELPLKSWIHDLTWNTLGTVLAAATHDSRVTLFTFPSSTLHTDPVVENVTLRSLPLRSIRFISPTQLIGGGFDFMAMLISANDKGEKWSLKGQWIAEAAAKRAKTEAELAREKFQNQASTGQTNAVELPTTRHKNVINTVSVLKSSDVAASLTSSELLFATASMDGRVEYWDLKSLVVA